MSRSRRAAASGGPSSRAAAHALLVWQKFIEGSTDATLEYAMFDPVTAKLDKLGTLNDAIQYYVYSSAYVPEIDRHRRHDDGGRSRRRDLIAPDGRRTATLDCLPASVRIRHRGVGHACVRTDPRRAAADTVARTGGHFGERRAAFADSVGFDHRRLPGERHRDAFRVADAVGREADFEPAWETPMPKGSALFESLTAAW